MATTEIILDVKAAVKNAMVELAEIERQKRNLEKPVDIDVSVRGQEALKQFKQIKTTFQELSKIVRQSASMDLSKLTVKQLQAIQTSMSDHIDTLEKAPQEFLTSRYTRLLESARKHSYDLNSAIYNKERENRSHFEQLLSQNNIDSSLVSSSMMRQVREESLTAQEAIAELQAKIQKAGNTQFGTAPIEGIQKINEDAQTAAVNIEELEKRFVNLTKRSGTGKSALYDQRKESDSILSALTGADQSNEKVLALQEAVKAHRQKLDAQIKAFGKSASTTPQPATIPVTSDANTAAGAEGLKAEANAAQEVTSSMREAANAKQQFANANNSVISSANQGSAALSNESNAAKKVKNAMSAEQFASIQKKATQDANKYLTDAGYQILGGTASAYQTNSGVGKISAILKDEAGNISKYVAIINSETQKLEKIKISPINTKSLQKYMDDFDAEKIANVNLSPDQIATNVRNLREILNLTETINQNGNQVQRWSISQNEKGIVTITDRLKNVNSELETTTRTFQNAEEAAEKFMRTNEAVGKTTMSTSYQTGNSKNSTSNVKTTSKKDPIEEAYKARLAAMRKYNAAQVKYEDASSGSITNQRTTSTQMANAKKELENLIEAQKQITMMSAQGKQVTLYDEVQLAHENDLLREQTKLSEELAQAKQRNATIDSQQLLAERSKYINEGTYDKYLATMEANLKKYSEFSSKSQYQTYLSQYNNMKNLASQLTSGTKDVNGEKIQVATEELAQMQSQLQTLKAQSDNTFSSLQSNLTSVITAEQAMGNSNSMLQWLERNTKAEKKYGQAIREAAQAAAQARTKTEATAAQQSFNQIVAQAKATGNVGKSLTGTFGGMITKLTSWYGATRVIMETVQQLKNMYHAVLDVDTAMVNLRKVSDDPASELDAYFDKAAENAKDLGASISDIISSTADFSRLGYTLKESEQLANIATLYKNVGDGIDIDTASSDIVSIMKAYGMEVDQAINIVDKLNEVGNNYAITSAGIGEALTRSGSSMEAAGNTLDETIALITAANSVVQDPVSLGTAFKTLSMRIRGAKTELEEMGEDTDGMVESTAKLQKEIKALTGVDIMQDKNTFKSTYQILKELSEVWTDLTDIQQASVTELIAGKRQGNIISALMKNFDIAEEAVQTSLNSEGSAKEEQEEWKKGMQYHLDSMSATFQKFSNTVFSSDFFIGLIDSGNTFLNILTDIIDNFGTLQTLLLGFGAFKGIRSFIKNFDQPQTTGCPSFPIFLGRVYHGGEYIITAI